jgi:hypothetical protein
MDGIMVKKVLYWTPRILAALFAVFISLFALDVFGEGYSFWETLAALLMHMIPTALVLAALFVAWHWELVGGLLFLFLGGSYIILFGGRAHWTVYLLMAGPLMLIGTLFLAHWWLASGRAPGSS